MGTIDKRFFYLHKYEDTEETVGDYFARHDNKELRPQAVTDKKHVGKYYKLTNQDKRKYVHILSILDEHTYEAFIITILDTKYFFSVCEISADIPLTMKMTERRFNKLYNNLLEYQNVAINHTALIKDTTLIPVCEVSLNRQLMISEEELKSFDPSIKMIDIKAQMQAENRDKLEQLRYQMIQLRKTHKGRTYIKTDTAKDSFTEIVADSIIDIYIRENYIIYEIKRYYITCSSDKMHISISLPTTTDIIYDLNEREILGYMPTYVWEEELKTLGKITKEFKK